MKPGKKARRRLEDRQQGWQKTIEDLKRRPGQDDPVKAFKMPGSMKRK